LDRYAASYITEWAEFVAALLAGREPPVGIKDARAPLVIGLAAWRSIREHRPVRIEELEAEQCLASGQPDSSVAT
jgi:myo-inositol 2-dehydrogenase/D-chiro-inositol 1-dehydrogenase